MKKKIDKWITPLLCVFLFAGLCLLLYPAVSNYWNSFTQSKAIAAYSEEIAYLDEDRYEQLWDSAIEYNESLVGKKPEYELEGEQKEYYDSLLNVTGNGVMGYIEIPSINCSLPIYHGTDVDVLQVAVGHLEWSSLPVGGKSTHCVLSGHRGLPSASLFTDLDKLIEGDLFMIRILDEILTYEVDQIRIVEPHEVEELQIVEGEDYCTLVTCTPYGVNSHRLLVRGHRIKNMDSAQTIQVTANALQIEPILVASILMFGMLCILFVLILIPRRK